MKTTSMNAVGFIYRLDKNGIVKNLTMKDSDLVGGKVGGIVVTVTGDGVVMGCVNYSNITAYIGAAGIVYNASTYSYVIGCTNYGDVTSESSEVGGICAYAWYPKAIVGCANYGTVTGPEYTNGIVGDINSSGSVRIEACFNGGDVISNDTRTSGYAISCYGFNWCYCTAGSTEYGDNMKYLNERIHHIDGNDCTFVDAVAAMNNTINTYNETATVKCNYRYVLNTDPETSEAYPIILQEVTDAQE